MKGILLFLAGVLVGANAVFFLVARKDTAPAAQPVVPPGATASQMSTAFAPTISRTPPPATGLPQITPNPAASSPVPKTNPAAVPTGMLLLPVAGISATQLTDTFNDRRGSDRRHEALDIMAPRGTPVLAVADGKIEKLFDSKQGGLTLYQFDRTDTFAYYYAHLDRYAPGITEGQQLKRGQLLGYVGSTGNANPDGPHLHFAIFQLGTEKRWWQGTPINPYPLVGGL